MNYEEFTPYQRVETPLTNFAHGYQLETGEVFYIEPWFYTQFTRLAERFPDMVSPLVDAMINRAKKHKYVVFARDFQNLLIKDERYVAIEIDDLIAELNIVIDDKSRGSDYGD